MKKENRFKVWLDFMQYIAEFKFDFIRNVMIYIGMYISLAVPPIIVRSIIDKNIVNKTSDGMYLKFAIFVAVIVINSIIVTMQVYFPGRLDAKINYKLKNDGFKKIQNLSISFFDKTGSGDIVSKLTYDTSTIAILFAWTVLDVIENAFIIVIYFAIMLSVNKTLTLIVLGMIPALGLLVYLFDKVGIDIYEKITKLNGDITSLFSNGILGAKTTKSLAIENTESENFEKVANTMQRKSIKIAAISSILPNSFILISGIFTVLVIHTGSNQVLNSGLTYGGLLLFISYLNILIWPIRFLAGAFPEIVRLKASVKRYMELINEHEEISDDENITSKYGDKFNKKHHNFEKINGNVEFKNVSFHYDKEKQIIDNFSLKVASGKVVAFVGETGSGKSTIINLLARFYEPVSGKILIDGIDYRQRSQSWLHSNIGYVMQSPELFSRTIRENIKYKNPAITDQEMIAVAKLLGAHQFIENLKDGYDTVIDDKGAGLSAGEKQLISFVRAMVGDPKLIFLDEATSYIDTKSEEKIKQAIRKMIQGRTAFVIAHRLSTIKNADIIVVLEKGKIVEQGNHQELMALKGKYFSMQERDEIA